MKRKLFLLALLLTSCSSNTVSSSSLENNSITNSSNNTSKESFLSNSSLSSSTMNSSSSTLTTKEQLEKFYSSLVTLEGNVQKMNIEILKTDYYATDISDEPLSISVKDISEAIRYNDDEGQILVRKGKQAYSEDLTDFENYEMQLFYDSEKFYRITDYETSMDTFEYVPFSEETIDENLNIGFPLTEKNNINYMILASEMEGYNIELIGFDQFTTNGIWNYSYSFTIFEEGSTKIKSQQYTYENKLTIVDGVIQKVEQYYLVELYAGGYCLNWSESNSIYTFTQGERLDFEGERFLISDFQ